MPYVEVCRSIHDLVSTPKPFLIEVLRSFLHSLQANYGIALRLDQYRFLSNLFQFINHRSSYHSMLHNLDADSAVK
jgi:hypothetical protein